MGWSPETAANAFLDTVKLYKKGEEETGGYLRTAEAESTEFVSAMAAGIKAQTIVEVSPRISPFTIALAAAARRTGGRLICILLESRSLEESRQALNCYPDLEVFVEFKIGDSPELLKRYKNVDFLLLDGKIENVQGLLKVVDMNASRSFVVINNLFEMKSRSGWVYSKTMQKKAGMRTVTLPIGKGMEVTKIGRSDQRDRFPKGSMNYFSMGYVETSKSKWLVAVDKKTGEEHFFRVRRKFGTNRKYGPQESA
ncbi:hypothetical protein EJ110_NYTH16847 [Nymphaea thermarum]|nr:hypothetical protein EJ110_NYTH16847 [Nymphaea thermarum]